LKLLTAFLSVEGLPKLPQLRRRLTGGVWIVFHLSRHALPRWNGLLASDEDLLVEESVLHVLYLELWVAIFPHKAHFGCSWLIVGWIFRCTIVYVERFSFQEGPVTREPSGMGALAAGDSCGFLRGLCCSKVNRNALHILFLLLIQVWKRWLPPQKSIPAYLPQLLIISLQLRLELPEWGLLECVDAALEGVPFHRGFLHYVFWY
jgi:hypothetical protein